MGSNDGIAFPVADLGSSLNMDWALTNGSSASDLASAFPATGIALFTLLLAAQLLIQVPASGFIGIDMAVDGLMANNHLICNLDWAHFPKRQLTVLPQSAAIIWVALRALLC